jgi:hypothetical protein
MDLNLCEADKEKIRTHLKVTHINHQGKWVRLTPRWSAILRMYLLNDTIEEILHPKINAKDGG